MTIEKKSLSSSFGKIEVRKDLELLKNISGFRVTPFLKEKLAYVGQLDSYERGSEITKHLLGVAISDTTIHRITDSLGLECEEWLIEEDLRNDLTGEELIYAQVDGSMILTREEKWKEVKLGRIFGASSCLSESESRNWLKESEYVSHLGGHKEFENKMSAILDEYSDFDEQLIFINDGARWQWSWIESEYPKATQILDFYHAMEHIGKFLTLILKPKERKQNMTKCSEILQEEGLDALWNEIEQLIKDKERLLTQTQQSEKSKLKKYLENNRKRMNYPVPIAIGIIKRGLLIGSGAIESAHRTVIQKRLKQAGQRWSIQGAENMLNLRTLNMSGHWDRLVNAIAMSA